MRFTRLLVVAWCAALLCISLVKGADEWQTLRIDHKDSLEKGTYLTDPYRCQFAGADGLDFYQNLVKCKESDEYTETTTYFGLVDSAIAAVNDLLRVQRTPLQLALKALGSPCEKFVLESADVSREDTDFVLYQTYRPVGPDNKLLLSKVCTWDKTTGRPTSGVINVAALYPTGQFQSVVEVTQEILRMLGFNTTVFANKNMVTRATVRGVENVPLVNSPMVLQMARDFYDCPTLPGMELDYDSTKDNTPLPYWRGRVAKDDVMSSAGNMTYVTPMTIAALEDTGLYKGNYSNAEVMPWGYKAGCNFVTQKCVDGGKSNFGNLFCTDGLSSSPAWQCTSDRRAIGHCGMGKASGDLPSPFQYFADAAEGGSLSTMDYCPVVQADITTSCTDLSNSTLSQFDISTSTRCFRTQGTGARYDGKPFNVACLRVKCNSTDLTYTIGLFKDTADTQTPCPANRKVDVSIVGGGGIFTKGFIRCPPYEQVCVATLNDASAISDQSAGDSAESDDDDSATTSPIPQPQPTTSSDKKGSSKSSESSASQSSSSSSDSPDSTDKPTAPPAPIDAASVFFSKVLALVLVVAMMLMM